MNVRTKLFILILLSVSGVLLVLACTSKYGVGLTHDSAAYIFAAKSLMAGKGYVYFGYGTPYVQWPPLFPTLLGAMAGIGIDPVDAGRYINAVVFGLILFFSGLWLFKHLRSGAPAAIGQASVLLSIPLLYVSTYLWTEPLFILFILIFLFKLENFLKENKLVDLALSAVFAALACLTRYIGITAVLTGLLLLLIQKRGFLKKIYSMAAFGFISSAPLALWILRNYLVFSTTVGSRTSSQYTLMETAGHAFNTAISWFLPYSRLAEPVKVFAAVAAVILLVGLAAAVLRNYSKHGGTGLSSSRNRDRTPVLSLGCFILIYTLYLTASAASVAIDAINNRLLAPVYVPLILVLFLGLDSVRSFLRKRDLKRIWGLLPVIVAGLWLIYPFFSAVALTRDAAATGAGGYSSDKWKYSEIIDYMESSDRFPGCEIYSNYPDAVYLLTGLEARYTPKKTGRDEYGLERFKRMITEGKCAYLVWFNSHSMAVLYNAEELGTIFSLKPVVEKSDGMIYIIEQQKNQ